MHLVKAVLVICLRGLPVIAALSPFGAVFWPEICGGLRRAARQARGVPARFALITLVAAMVLLPVLARAQDAVPSPPSGDSGSIVLWFFAAAVGGLVALIAWALQRYLGIVLARNDREALHSALMTGALAVAARYGLRSAGLDLAAPEEVVAYARRSVPDAIHRLGAPDDVLDTLAMSKLRQATTTPAVVTQG